MGGALLLADRPRSARDVIVGDHNLIRRLRRIPLLVGFGLVAHRGA